MNYTDTKKEAVKFLAAFTRSDFDTQKEYNKFKVYRMQHNKGTLTKGSYETVLRFLGYEKSETWTEPPRLSNKLIDIL